MFLLNHQELLSSINSVQSVGLWGQSVNFWLGIGFVLTALGAFIWLNFLSGSRKYHDGRKIFLIIFLSWWAISYISSLFINIEDLLKSKQILTKNIETKLQTRLCNIDQAQNFGGVLCALTPFVSEVRSAVPSGKTIAISSSSYFGLFLNYYLLADYKFAPQNRAAYLVAYMPDTVYQIMPSGEILAGAAGAKTSLGVFQPVKVFNQGMVILKRQ